MFVTLDHDHKTLLKNKFHIFNGHPQPWAMLMGRAGGSLRRMNSLRAIVAGPQTSKVRHSYLASVPSRHAIAWLTRLATGRVAHTRIHAADTVHRL